MSPFFFYNGHAEGLQTLLQNRFGKLSEKIRMLPEKERQLVRLYVGNTYHPIWIEEKEWRWKPYLKAALQKLERAEEEALHPNDYQKILFLFEKEIDVPKDLNKALELDVLISKVMLDFIDDLAGERLTPMNISKLLYIKNEHVDAGEILLEGLSSDHPIDWLTHLTFQQNEYQHLKILLKKYRRLQKEGGWPTHLALEGKKKKLEKGASGENILLLRQQLFIQGDLKDSEPSPLFDETVESALKQFQRRHALEEDGIVGPATLKVLNTPVEERIKQIIVSMERWRWLPRKPAKRYLLVNISGFFLKAYEDGKKVLEMPVITGRAYRKTPVFTSAIYSIRFNPSWHVPTRIAVKDKLPLIRRNPSYLSQKGYSIYDSNGTRLNITDVDWNTVGGSSFPYRLVQSPGSHNALGKIRFSIKSPFDVYLHDTPDKHLFKKAHRDLSSGCIRVKEPVKLAHFIFNQAAWTEEKISQKMSGTKTENVDLSETIPVYITYFTAWQGDDGLDYFMNDHYKQDDLIWQALQFRTRD